MTTLNYNLSSQGVRKLNDNIISNIEVFFDLFGLKDLKPNKRMYIGPCPIHGGDNQTAFNIWYNGQYVVGNWKCRTHECEKNFLPSAIGFIRGMLSRRNFKWSKRGDRIATFEESIKFAMDALKLTKEELENLYPTIQQTLDSNRFISQSEFLSKKQDTTKFLTRKQVRQNLLIPSEHMTRGEHSYSREILNKYDVGYCNTKGKPMYCRSVVPVYDDSHKFMIGCSGRSIFRECPSCGSFHPGHDCPPKDKTRFFPKWKHVGFKTESVLYNYWYAKDYIKDSHVVILVESPGNVWRLEEAGIHNSVALFGNSLKEGQRFLIDCSGALAIITIMDNDEAGKTAAQTISDECELVYHVKNIQINHPDVGKMSVDDVLSELVPSIKNVENSMKF